MLKREKIMDKLSDEHILKIISTRLKKTRASVSVAESVTAGLLQCAIASAPNAMEFFQGGITAYNVAQKYKHLSVEPIHAESVHAVSQQVALQMANQVCDLFASNWGIGITGFASPVPESKQKLYAYYALVKNKQWMDRGKLTCTTGQPLEVQRKYIQALLRKFASALSAK